MKCRRLVGVCPHFPFYHRLYNRNIIARLWQTKFVPHAVSGFRVTGTPSSNAPTAATKRSEGAPSAVTRV